MGQVVTGEGAVTSDRDLDDRAEVTGEVGHHDALHAEEAGINLVCGGHYATETVGVKALASHVAARFDLPWGFVEHATGL